MQIGISIFILGMFVALANAALSTAIGFNKDIGKAIFLAIIAVGMLFLGLGFIFPQKHYTKRRTKAPLAEDETEPDRMTSSLNNVLANGQESAHEIEFPKDEREPIHAEIPSVTEHTTSQLN